MFKQGLQNLFGQQQSAFTPERNDNLISTVNISEVLGSQLENAITNGSGSLFNRIAIYFDAIEVTLQTCGLGIGPGSFTKYFQTHPHRSPLVDPHNWWIEILAQYGILVFLAYTGSFLYLLKHLITAFFRTRNTEFSIMAAVFCSFAVSCVAPSSFLGHNYQWAIAAIAVSMLSFEKEYRTL